LNITKFLALFTSFVVLETIGNHSRPIKPNSS
jgi:hypothetical protein